VDDKFWREVVLPSVGLPDKPTYNFREAMIILDCSKMTLWRKIKKGEIHYPPNKKFYRVNFVCYFCEGLAKECTPAIKD
jgi:hypothetical protein